MWSFRCLLVTKIQFSVINYLWNLTIIHSPLNIMSVWGNESKKKKNFETKKFIMIIIIVILPTLSSIKATSYFLFFIADQFHYSHSQTKSSHLQLVDKSDYSLSYPLVLDFFETLFFSFSFYDLMKIIHEYYGRCSYKFSFILFSALSF